MSFGYLEAVKKAIDEDEMIHDLVDGQIFIFKSVEESEQLLRSSEHKSMISVELASWPGSQRTTEPVFVVDVRCRAGAEACLEIVRATKELLEGGIDETIEGTSYQIRVKRIEAPIVFDRYLAAHRSIMKVYGSLDSPPEILSLAPNLPSPQQEGRAITFVCTLADGAIPDLLYRFLLNGPTTGGFDRVVQGWSSSNSWVWQTSDLDVGQSTIKVQVRDGSTSDEISEASLAYTISASLAPTISSLTPNRSSPREQGTAITFICTASGTDLQYRFILNGPGTGSSDRVVQGWSSSNSWTWQTSGLDLGWSSVKVQVRSGTTGTVSQSSLSYNITSSLPSDASITSDRSSPQKQSKAITFIGSAIGSDLQYRFILNGPATGSLDRVVQGWSSSNSWTWQTSDLDVGQSTVKVQIRSGTSEDVALEMMSYTITANSAPTIAYLTPNLASPQPPSGQAYRDITFTCIASDSDSDGLEYRFLLSGPGTGSRLRDMTGWTSRNSWTWNTSALDVGTSTIYCQVRDRSHAEGDSYDDQESLSYTIQAASLAHPAISISSFTATRTSPQVEGREITFVCVSSAPNNGALYRFWLYGPRTGSKWIDMTGWSASNSWTWKTGRFDQGQSTIKVQVKSDDATAYEGHDAETTMTFTIDKLSISSFTPSLSSPKAAETTIVFTLTPNSTANASYRFWQKGPGTGNVWRDMTGWISRNSWSWRTADCDIGTNYVRAQVICDPDEWDDSDTTGRQSDLTYTIN